MHLMDYLCRPKHIAVVMILQSQLHRVIGRNSSSDLTIRPLSSTVEDLGMKTVLLAAKCFGDKAAPQHTVINIEEQEVRPQSTRTPVVSM